jgi:fibronectin-binding autotransporter adhesin
MAFFASGKSAGERRSVFNRGAFGRRRAGRALALSAAAACLMPGVSMAANGTWNPIGFTGANGNGLWSTTTNWTGGIVADGASNLADFSTLNITADTTVSVDTPRTIGQLKFADTTQSNQWFVDNGGNSANVLTLNNGASQPIITVNGATQITTISDILGGVNGFVKTGTGSLTLSGANTFTGQITVNSTTSATGSDLYLSNNSALGVSTNTLYVDPGSSNITRVRLNSGVTIANPITLHTVRGPQQNGELQTNGNVSATLSGPITIDGLTTSGGDFSGPNDATLTNFLNISGSITLSSAYNSVPSNLTNVSNNGVTIRAGNVILAGGGSYYRIEQRDGQMRLGANNGIATNAYLDLGQNAGNPAGAGTGLDMFGFNQTLVGIENLSNQGVGITNSVNSAVTLTLAPSTAQNLTLSGSVISDAQATLANSLLSVVVNGNAAGLQTFANAASTYHGSTTLTSGILAVNTLANGGAVSSIGASSNAASNLVFGGGTLRYTGTSIATDRNFTLNSSTTGTIDVSTAATTLTMNGAGTGGGGLIKAGAGTLLFTTAQGYSGNTTVSAGTLLVNSPGSIGSANVSVASSATLGGTGTLSGVVTPASGGIIAPGGTGTVGILTVGGLTMNTGGQVNFEFGSGNDQMTVSNAGGLTLNSGNIFLYNTGTTTAFAINGTYTLFNINGGLGGSLDNLTISNPTAGKFYSLNSSSTAVNLVIGDATTLAWSNGNGTNLWTDTGNWTGGVFPNAVGQTASFGAASGSGNINLNGNKTVSGIVFNNTGTSYNLTGSGSLILDNGAAAGAITVTSGTHTISVPVTLNGAVAVMTTNLADSLTLGGNVTGPSPVTMTGPGALNLTGNNSFTTLSINGSTVNVGTGTTGTLGSGAVTLSNNATLNFNTNSNYNYGQNITGSGILGQIGAGTTTVGAVNVSSVNVSNGALITTTLNQTNGINVTGTGSLTASGAVSGGGKLIVNSPTGTVSLGGSNSYSGGTELDAGKIVLNNAGAFPANTGLAVNGGTLDMNANSITISNILDLTTSTGAITNNGSVGTTSTVSFNGNSTNYDLYAALNDGINGGKVALSAFIQNNNSSQDGTTFEYRLALHSPSTYSGGTTVTKESIEADATNALGTGPVVLALNNSSTNNTRLYIAGGVTLPNAITIQQANAFAGFGAIQYGGAVTTGNATLTGTITVQADPLSGGTFVGPTTAGTTLNVNGAVNATGTATNISVRAGNVTFAGGGSYPRLDVYPTSNVFVGATNGVSTSAIINTRPDPNQNAGGTFDIHGNNQTVAGLTGALGIVTNSLTAATLTLNTVVDSNFAGNITGAQTLVKSGSATQTLAGVNTYSGNTIIHGGTLRLSPGNIPVPVASYSYDDGSTANGGTGGTAMDGSISGSVDLSQPGKFGDGAASFGGDGSSVDIGSGITDMSGAGRWTFATWIKTTQTGATMFSKSTGGAWQTGNSVVYLTDTSATGAAGGSVPGDHRNGDGSIKGSTSVTDGQWHFVTITDDSGTKAIYVDGVQNTLSQNLLNNADVGNLVQLGFTADTNVADGSQFLSGELDETKFYNTALTSTQVQSLFNTNGLGLDTVPNVLPAATAVNIDTAGGTLDIGGAKATIGSLTGVSGTSVILGPANLTTGDSTNTNFAGVISGTGGVIKQGGGNFTLSGVNTYIGATSVTQGTLTVADTGVVASTGLSVNQGATAHVNGNLTGTPDVTAAGTSGSGSTITFGVNDANNNATIGSTTPILARTLNSLTIGSGSSVSLDASTNHANRTVLVTPTLAFTDASAGAFTAASRGTLNLSNNDLVLRGTAGTVAANLTNVQHALKSGLKSAGYWNGTSGIVSSSAAGDTRFLTTLGYRQSNGTAFDGVNTTTNDVLVKYTYYGDADLNGTLNGADYAQIDAGFGMHLTGWINGDFNYDGVVDGTDYSLIDNTFNQISATGATPLVLFASPASLSGGSASAVPEPTTLGLLGIGAMGLLGRRRRRNV